MKGLLLILLPSIMMADTLLSVGFVETVPLPLSEDVVYNLTERESGLAYGPDSLTMSYSDGVKYSFQFPVGVELGVETFYDVPVTGEITDVEGTFGVEGSATEIVKTPEPRTLVVGLGLIVIGWRRKI